jgi:hypothetical protein
MPGHKDSLWDVSFTCGDLLQGKDITCMSFINMMVLERDIINECSTFASTLEHARDIKKSQEEVHDFSAAV